MSPTHDYVIANGTGSSVRSDINDALAAVVSQNSSSTAPATTYAYMIWVDTTTNIVKMRNGANSAWIELFETDGEFGSKTFNGNITLNAQGDLRFADSDSSNWVAFQAPATVASNVTWTLPSADGTANQTLITNGSGTLSWATPTSTSDKITEGNTEAEVVDTGSDGHFKVTTEGTERFRCDSSGRLLVNTSSAASNYQIKGGAAWSNTTGVTPTVQIAGTGANFHTGLSINKYNADGYGAVLSLGLSLSNTLGTNTLVTNASGVVGTISFNGNDGTNFIPAAQITCEPDGTTGTNDMPGRLMFFTTGDGASNPTERLRIANNGAWGLAGANYGTSGQVLKSNGSGSAPTWQNDNGKILQVVQAYKTDVFSTSATGTTDVTGLSVSITPSSSSNKILVLAAVSGFSNNGSGAAPTIFRNSTQIGQATGVGSRQASSFQGDLYTGDGTGSGQMQYNSTCTFLDSPATTSSITYKVSVQSSGGQIYINRGEVDTDSSDENRSVSHITVMEVAA